MTFSQSTHLLFVFADFNVHHRDWVTYSGGTELPGELCYNFSISNDLNQMVNSPTWITACDSHSPALLDLILSSDASICFTNLEILTMLLSQFPLTFLQIHNDMPDWDGLRDHLRNVPWKDIFKLGASATASEFCELVQVGNGLDISHCKYQIKPHSSPWFSAACAAAVVHRNHFFRLYQSDKSSESKVNFRQANNHCKRLLEAAELAYANKTKESIIS